MEVLEQGVLLDYIIFIFDPNKSEVPEKVRNEPYGRGLTQINVYIKYGYQIKAYEKTFLIIIFDPNNPEVIRTKMK